MPQVATKIEEYEALAGKVKGHGIRVVTYRLGGRYFCMIENEAVGASICRATGNTRIEALTAGLSQAEKLISEMPEPPLTQKIDTAFIDRIVMMIEGAEVAFTIEEFLSLNLQQRMEYILSGKLSFLDGFGTPIPIGKAIEMLRIVGR